MRHDPGCPATDWDAWQVEGTGLTLRQCKWCQAVELLLPPDTSTPKARYRAGLPQRRTDRKKDRP